MPLLVVSLSYDLDYSDQDDVETDDPDATEDDEGEWVDIRQAKRLKPTRPLLYPLRSDLADERSARAFCLERGLGTAATRRVLALALGHANDRDHRDQRSLPKTERVPRSLELVPSPPHYWDIDYFPSPPRTEPGDLRTTEWQQSRPESPCFLSSQQETPSSSLVWI